MTTNELPPLPEPDPEGCTGNPLDGWNPAFNADQMWAYARLAIEQDRARPVPGEEDVLHAINQFLEYGEQEFGK